MQTIFVTVGTTKFDSLIKTLCTDRICKVLRKQGCKLLKLQIGAGDFEPEASKICGVSIEFFRYKPSIAEDIQNADLVISHAGAGSVLETLGAKKPLLVVINEELMNNHQLELAYQLHKDGHLLYGTCSSLQEKLESIDISTLQPFEPGAPQKFASFLDKFMGVS